MHYIAIGRCFRHIAMERRNRLQTESHFSAQNLAFMFGLLESCKLNNVNFGEYIEDIEDGTDAEVTKTSQAVA